MPSNIHCKIGNCHHNNESCCTREKIEVGVSREPVSETCDTECNSYKPE